MLKLENLSVAVNGRPILHDVNLYIMPGEVHVLFGAVMGFARYKQEIDRAIQEFSLKK